MAGEKKEAVVKQAKDFTREFRFMKEGRTLTVIGQLSNAEMCNLVKSMLNDGWCFNFDDLKY